MVGFADVGSGAAHSGGGRQLGTVTLLPAAAWDSHTCRQLGTFSHPCKPLLVHAEWAWLAEPVTAGCIHWMRSRSWWQLRGGRLACHV